MRHSSGIDRSCQADWLESVGASTDTPLWAKSRSSRIPLIITDVAQKEKEGADGQLGRLNAEHHQLCASKEELQKAHDELQANAGKLQAQVYGPMLPLYILTI